MEIAIRRQTFCGKSHLHRMKTQRSSLSKLDGEEKLQTSLPNPQAPRSIQLLYKSAMPELFQEQQRRSSIQTLRRSNTRRPTSSSSSASSYSSESSMASRRRLLEESEKQLARALAQAKEATVHGAQSDDLNARVAACSTRPSLLKGSISSSSCMRVNLDSETEGYEPKQADIPIISSSARSNVMTDGFDTTGQRECQICFDKLDAPQAHVCVSCYGSFCASCTLCYIKYKVLEGEVSQKKMVCPAPRCKNPLSEKLVQALVSPEMFGKYKTFLSNQKVGIRFCPRAGCCAILNEPLHSSTRRAKCQTCKQESCMRCGDDFHKMPTCRHVEKHFGHWKKRHNVRGCPSCKAVIEKQGGCSHMKCFQCDQEFCWSCLRPWHNHDETLCLPLSFLRSKSQKYGCWAPMRVVTKTAIIGIAAVAAVAGVGFAVVVLPPVLGFQYAKDSYRRHKYARLSYICVVDWDIYLH